MEIPSNAGLGELRKLLAQAENQITEWTPKLTQYRIDESNAKGEYNHSLAAAKVLYQDEKTPTMMNAKAVTHVDVRSKQLVMQSAKANLIMADDLVKQVQGTRDTLKCMIKSEINSY